MIRLPSNVILILCGIRDTSTTSASSARKPLRAGHPAYLCQGTADDPDIDYNGLSSVSTSDVLDRFKEAKVGISQESQFDPTKVKKAEVTIKELLSEHGRQFATVRTEIRPIPPAAVAITFVVKEGPKVKVGKIIFTGQQTRKHPHFAQRHEELAADRSPPLHLPGKSLRQDL